jgi:DNA-binding IclR family transcriptional regulator
MKARTASRATASGPPGSTADNPVLTVQRGLELLRAFRCERTALSNTELVRRTGMSKAAVSRLTSTLLQLGFLRHVPGGRQFELGTGAFSIGNAFIAASPLLKAAQPFMQELADKLDVSVALAIGNQLEMLYVGYSASRHIATLRLGVGSLLPMASTSIGRAYLWGMPPVQQRAQIAALRRAAGPEGESVEAGIRHGFAELESEGTCFAVGVFQRDAFGIALPVRLGRERLLMALSCGAVAAPAHLSAMRQRIAPALKTAAPQLETLLADIEGMP